MTITASVTSYEITPTSRPTASSTMPTTSRSHAVMFTLLAPSYAGPSRSARHRSILRVMASYSVNPRAVKRAQERIDARQYVLDSDWGEVQPDAEAENRYLRSHSWEEFAEWHLGLTDGAADGTKARYAFVMGDLRHIHRSALI